MKHWSLSLFAPLQMGNYICSVEPMQLDFTLLDRGWAIIANSNFAIQQTTTPQTYSGHVDAIKASSFRFRLEYSSVSGCVDKLY